MPRSRLYTPSVERDGNWYKMRGGCAEGALYRWETESGKMMTDVVNLNNLKRPVTVPTFDRRYTPNFAHSNNFSDHDNRNTTQDFGHYFGRGLGRKLFPEIDAHKSQTDPVFWYTTEAGRRDRLDTTQRISYKDRTSMETTESSANRPWTVDPGVTAGVKTQVIFDPSKYRRRFPRYHPVPREGKKKLSTNIAYPSEHFKTYLQTLCSTQEPFLKPNRWRYSYHDVKI